MDSKKGCVLFVKNGVNYVYGNLRDNSITYVVVKSGFLKIVGGKVGLMVMLMII